MRIIRLLVYTLSVFFLAWVAITIAPLLVFDYGELISFFKSKYPGVYRIDQYDSTYLTRDHYAFLITYVIPAVFILVVSVLILEVKFRFIKLCANRLATDAQAFKGVFVQSFHITTHQKLILATGLLFLLGIKAYLYFTFPFYVDEAFNFVYFTNQGVLSSIIFANNHVVTNAISSIWWQIGFGPEFSSRIVSIVSAFFVHLLIYAITTRHFGFRTGVASMLLTGVCFWTNVYGVESGAYMLMTFWVLLALASMTSTEKEGRHFVSVFVISCVAGFLTTRLFLIPFISLVILWVGLDYQRASVIRVAKVARVIGLVCLITGLLYLPMFIWSGPNSIFHGNVTKSDLIFEMPSLFECISVMTDIVSKSYIALMAVVGIELYLFRSLSNGEKVLVAFKIITIVSIALFCIVVQVYPPSRALIYTNVIFYGTIGIILFNRVDRLPAKIYLRVVTLVVAVKLATSLYVLNFGWQRFYLSIQDKESYVRLEAVANQLIGYHPKMIFAESRDTWLPFYVALSAIENREDVRFTFDPLQANEADLILADSRSDDLPVTKIVYEGEFGTVYLKE